MRRTKRWLAMAMAVLITASTLAGDYMIATAAEVSVADEVATEEAANEEVVAEQKTEEDNPFEITVYQQPTEAPVVEATQAPATEAPVVEESTQAPAEEPQAEATTAPVEDTTEVPEAAPTETPAEDATAMPEAEATEAPVEDATAMPEAEATETPAEEVEVTPEAEETVSPEATEEPAEESVIVDEAITISYKVNNDAYGYIEGETEIFASVDVEEKIHGAVAVANDGYVFVNWTNEDGTEVGDKEFFVPAERVTAEYTANFAEKAEEVITYPAVNFGSFYVSNMNVAISAPEGAFPEGTKVSVNEVSVSAALNAVEDAIEDNVEIAEVKAVDITFTDKNGNEIQPLVPISVSFSQANLDGNSFAVYHADGSDVEKVADLNSADGGAIKADSFSMYVLVGVNSVNIGEMASYTMYQGETITVYADTTDTNGTFSVTGNNGNIITLGSKTTYIGHPAVQVTASGNKTGEVIVNYKSGSYEQTIKIVVKEKIAVSFDVDGGNAAAPSVINAVVGTEITMPSYAGTKNGYQFVGWAKNKNVNGSGNYDSGADYIIYPAGSKYVVVENEYRNGWFGSTTFVDKNKFYAIWASTSGTDAEFYIRKESTIPYEPQGQDSSDFSSKITIKNAIKVASFYTNQQGVEERLNTVPSDDQIKAVRSDYNPETDYIVWYVIKKENTWHVDGVLLKKELVNLTYDPNAGEVTVSNMPVGRQYAVGATATVDAKIPSRTGYTFDSWNTEPGGNGIRYTGNNTLTINASTTLYAQWVPDSNTKYVVQRYDAATGTKIDELSRSAVTDSIAHATETDKTLAGYTFVEGHASNVLSGLVVADGSLVLKLYFEAKEVTVIITENSGEEVYDGTVKGVSGYTVSINEPSYTEADFTFNGNATVNGTDAGTYNMNLKASDFVNISKNFTKVTFEIVDGTLTIDKRNVTLSSATDAKEYDGTSLTNDEVMVGGDGFASGEGATYDVTGSQTDAGSSANAFTYTLNNGTKAENYNITTAEGTLTVTPVTSEVAVTITGNKDIKEYNGTAQSVSGYDVAISSSVYKETDFEFNGEAVAKGTDVGSYPMGLAKEQFKNTNANFTNVIFNVTDGSLEITPVKVTVTITGNTDTKTYNGSEQNVIGYEVEISDSSYTKEDFAFSGEAVAKGTNVGTYAMGLTTTQFTNNNENYDVTFVVNDGSLTITKKAVTVNVTGTVETKTYTGAEQKAEGYTVSISDTAYTEADFTFSGVAEAKGTDVGEYPMGLAVAQFANNNANYDVTFSVTDGKLTIAKKAVTVTITGNTDSKVFNGAEQKVEGYEVSISDTLYTEADFTFSGEAVAKGTNVGSYPMGLAESQFTNNNDNFDVTFSVTDGQLTITKKAVTVTITGNTDSQTYNGSEQKIEGYEVSIGDTLYTEDDFTFSGEAVAKGTNVGSYPMGLAEEQFANKNDNFTVNFVVYDGNLEITKDKVVVTIAGNKDSLVYNGSEQKVEGYKVSNISNGLYKETDFTFNGTAVASGTAVGTYPMGLAADQFANNNTNFDVEFKVTDGELKITKAEVVVTITGNKDSKVYNGSEQQVEGYSVSISDSKYTTADFTFSGEAVAKRTEVGTTSMGLAESQFTNNNANFDVTFSVTDGQIEVTPLAVSVTITGNKDSKVYNGAEQQVEGYAVSISDALYTEADFTFTGDAVAKGTDVDTYAMGLTAEQFINDNKNFKVTFNVTDGELEITPLAVSVTVTGNKDSKVYNGEKQQVENYEVSISNPLYKEADFTFAGEAVAAGTDVDTYAMGLATSQFVNKNDNFDVTFTVTDGQLEITPLAVDVTITGNKDSKTYNGAEQKVEDYTVEISNALYTEKDFTFAGEAVAAGTDVDTYPMNLAVSRFTNTNDNFDVTFSVTDGQLEITKKAVTMTSDSSEKVYDGKELTSKMVVAEGFVDGEGATYKVTGSQTEVGSSENIFTYTLNEGTNTDNYDITTVYGTLTVTPVKETVVVTITGNTDTVLYDGTAHTVTGYTVSDNSDVYTEEDFTFGGNAAVTETDAGTYAMGLKAEQFTNTNKNFDDVTFVVTDGELTINKRNVTLTSADDTKVYDGKALTNGTVTVSDDGFAGGEGADYNVTGSQTVVGSSANAFTYTLNAGTKAANYTITKTEGTLEVTPVTDKVTVTITENSDTLVYNGSAQQVAGYTVEIDNALYTEGDFTFNGTDSVSGTNVGTYAMELKPDDFTNTSKNFTNVEFVIVDGTLEITPAEVTVTITGNNATKAYNKAEQQVEGYTVSENSDLYTEADFTFSGEAVAKGTAAGEYPMGLAVSQFTNNNKNFDVTFKVTDGWLVITADDSEVVVTITGKKDSVVYDGQAHTVTGYDVEFSNPLYTEADFIFNGTAVAEGTEVGTYAMGLADSQFTNINANFKKVTFKVTDGGLEITPTQTEVVVTITENSGTATYDGVEHTVTGYTVTSISNDLYTVNDFTFNGNATVSGTDAGTYDMDVKATDFTNTNKNFTNVKFVIVDGKLEITPIDVVVTITEHSGEYAYDGQAHTVSGYDVEISNPLYKAADFTFSGNDSVSGMNAGTYNMGLTAEDFKNTNENFANVTFNIVDGQLVIKPIDVTVTITEHGDEVDYDGKAHTVTGYDVAISNELYTEEDFTFSGNASVSGTAVGTYAMELKAEDFTNTNANFANVTFVIEDGQLVINPIDVVVTITEHSDEVDYDGAEHTVTGYDVEISNPLYTEADFTVSESAIASVSGTAAGSYDMGLTAADFTNTNANFANVTFNIVDGQLVIKPIDVTVTITEHSDEVDYDGAEHTVTGYDVEISNPLYTEADFTFSGNAEVKGTDAGTYDMELSADDFTNNNANFANVTFVIVDGQLVIKPIDVTVTITEHSDEVDYDGVEHTVTGYDVEISNPLYTEADFTFSGTDSVSGTNAGTYDMELSAADFANTNDNFDNVTFVIVDGQLTINKINATVTIKGNKDSKVYNGSEQSVEGYVATFDTTLYAETDFTFSGEAVAKGTNVGEYPMGLTADQFANTNANFETVTFNVTDGQLDITPVTDEVVVKVTGNTAEYTYDGTEKVVTGYEVTEISNSLYTTADFTFGGNAEVKGTDAAEYPMGLAADQFTNTNANFAKVTFEVTDGKLTINPIAEVIVTIQGNTGAVAYDGTEKSVEGYKVTSINNELYTEADFGFGGEAVAKGTNVGEYPMGLAADQFENTNANFAKVTFEVTDGKLTITPKDDIVVIITENSDTVTYNGSEQSVTGYEVTSISSELYTEADFEFKGDATAKGTMVGTYDMELTAEDFENINDNFTNVTFQIVDGMLTINPISEEVVVTITENSGSYVYDGTEKTVEGYEVTSISNKLYTEEDFAFSGEAVVKGTEAGTYDMELTAENFENLNTEVFKNVRFEIVDGQLVIDPYAEEILVQITGKTDSVLYDGQSHSVEGYDITIDDAAVSDVPVLVRLFADRMSADSFLQVEDIQLKEGCSDKVEKTNAGQYAQGLTADSFENTNKNFNNVTFEVTDGSLEITKRQVTLTSASDSKVYDGKYFSNKKITVSGDGFAEGEGATYKVSGRILDVGEVKNKFTYTLNGNTLADNYDIKTVFGTLEITPKPVVPAPEEPTPAPTATPVVIIEDDPVPMADGPVPEDDGPAVLGARRTDDAAQAVLGARRGTEYAVLGKRRRPNTGDSVELILWYLALGMSMATAIAAATKVRKNKVD